MKIVELMRPAPVVLRHPPQAGLVRRLRCEMQLRCEVQLQCHVTRVQRNECRSHNTTRKSTRLTFPCLAGQVDGRSQQIRSVGANRLPLSAARRRVPKALAQRLEVVAPLREAARMSGRAICFTSLPPGARRQIHRASPKTVRGRLALAACIAVQAAGRRDQQASQGGEDLAGRGSSRKEGAQRKRTSRCGRGLRSWWRCCFGTRSRRPAGLPTSRRCTAPRRSGSPAHKAGQNGFATFDG